MNLSAIILRLEQIARELEIPNLQPEIRTLLADEMNELAEGLYRFAGRLRREARRDV